MCQASSAQWNKVALCLVHCHPIKKRKQMNYSVSGNFYPAKKNTSNHKLESLFSTLEIELIQKKS